ncbi:MAG: L-2-hydroxyglutarate oxidase [Flavobacteriales bacterium]|nr:L-2-hydroxyglutarate oxidase [Flavobacteriales bacterium]
MKNKFDIIVIGGGLVGLSTAYKIQKKLPNKNILLIEKEDDIATHQSGRNSGVIHSGLYYKEGSLKAKNCVSGRHELVKFAKQHNIQHDICGKLVVATNQNELLALPNLQKRGHKNGLKNIEQLSPQQIQDIEPYVSGLGALFIPETGIINYIQLAKKIANLIIEINSDSKILTSTLVRDIKQKNGKSLIITNTINFECDHLIACAGLFSDSLAKLDGAKFDLKIVGFRGDYYTLTDSASHKVNNLIYPVPNPEFPFLGVHFTRMTNGEIECGPNAVFTFKREGYRKTDFNFKDTIDALSYCGTWKLFKNHWKFGLNEMIKASSKTIFLRHLQKLIPSLKLKDIRQGRSGVRAMALGSDGEVIDDFKIIIHKRNIHVLNAPSPAATACLSIGETISEKLLKIL